MIGQHFFAIIVVNPATWLEIVMLLEIGDRTTKDHQDLRLGVRTTVVVNGNVNLCTSAKILLTMRQGSLWSYL